MTNQDTTGEGLVGRFLSFERLIGSSLIKVMYYLGLAGIGLTVLMGLITSLGLSRFNSSAGLVGILLDLLLGVLGVVVWRYVCELSILAFQVYNRLGEIRDRLPGAAPAIGPAPPVSTPELAP